MFIVGSGTLDHAEQGREPPDESVTVVVGGGGKVLVVRPAVVAPPWCCCCCCCCCFCEGTRLDRGNRALLRDIVFFGGLAVNSQCCVFFDIILYMYGKSSKTEKSLEKWSSSNHKILPQSFITHFFIATIF